MNSIRFDSLYRNGVFLHCKSLKYTRKVCKPPQNMLDVSAKLNDTFNLLFASVQTTFKRQSERSLSTYYWPRSNYHCMRTGSKVTFHILLAHVRITVWRQGQRSLSTYYWPLSASLYGDRVKGHFPHTTGPCPHHCMETESKVTFHILLAPVRITVWRQGQRSLSTYYWPLSASLYGDRVKGHFPHTTGPCAHHCMETGSKVTFHILLAPVRITVWRQGQRSLSTYYWPLSASLYGDRVKGHFPHTTGPCPHWFTGTEWLML